MSTLARVERVGHGEPSGRLVGAPARWGIGFGVIQAASPLAFWWLDAATVYALGLVLIASVYFGFAVADGRAAVIAVEVSVAGGPRECSKCVIAGVSPGSTCRFRRRLDGRSAYRSARRQLLLLDEQEPDPVCAASQKRW